MNFSFKYGEKIYTKADFVKSGDDFVCDLGNQVKVVAKETIYPEFDASDWVLYFENSGIENSLIFSEINDCDISYTLKNPDIKAVGYKPSDSYPCVTSMNGVVEGYNYLENDKVSAEEYATEDTFLHDCTVRSYKNIGEGSSDGQMPFFDLHTKADGIMLAIGWTGLWRVDFSRNGDIINIKSGLQTAKFYLKPEETLRTSSALVMEYNEGDDKYNKFRRLIKKYFSHKTNYPEKRDGLLAFELWGSLPSEEMVKRLNELRDHGIRFDDIWIDAGWYGEGEVGNSAFVPGWPENTGNWQINEYVHPNKLQDVKEAAKAAGANIMLWFEPERAVRGTPMTKEHPEWFLDVENGNLLLYYDNEDAWNYVYELLCHYIETLEFSCYRQDFNFIPTEYFEKNDKENRQGVSEIKHITGMYRLWDALLEKYPHLLIDNCAGGGRRFDIETLKRSIAFFRSDYQCNFNENSTVLQCHNAGISKYLPYSGCTTKTKNDTYAIRSSYSASWGGAFYNAIFQDMNEEDFAWAKKVVDDYRRIRKYFSCDFYNHGSEKFDDTSWAIWQYHDEETQSGIVMAFRRDKSPFDNVEISLCGLADGRYIYTNLDSGETCEGDSTLKISLPEKHSSVIIEYSLK